MTEGGVKRDLAEALTTCASCGVSVEEGEGRFAGFKVAAERDLGALEAARMADQGSARPAAG